MAFLLATRAFRRIRPRGKLYFECVDGILKLFIHTGSAMEINIAGSRKKKIIGAVQNIKSKLLELDYFIFRAAEKEVYRMVKSDVFKRFRNTVVIQKLLISETQAASWCWKEDGFNKLESHSCTTLPNTINLLVRR